jgi:ribonuclease P/MRP protein subunit RPP1
MLLQKDDFNKLKTKIKDSKEQIIFTSDDDEFNRKVLEKLSINILLINQKNRKDFQKQRDSGFNQVLAKIAKKNNVQIGINLDEIIESNQKEKSKILARVHQNIKICNKNKIHMQFIGKCKRNLHDLKSLGLTLGMPTWITKSLKIYKF